MTEIIYTVSEREIRRRLNAFTSFLASLYVCLILLFLLAYPTQIAAYFSFSVITALGVLLLFLFFRGMIAGFFKSIRKSKIIVTPAYLKRITPCLVEQFPISDISTIKIKKTSGGSTREIGLYFANGRRLYIDGLNDLESLVTHLVTLGGNTITLQTSSEPIDYDHTAFYPILGLLVSMATVYGMKFASGLRYGSLYYVYFAFAGYLMMLGGYFIIRKPLTIRYGNTSKRTDNLMGFLILAASILIGVSAYSWKP